MIPGNSFVRDISCCHGNQIFDAMFGQILTFMIFFFLLTISSKLIDANFLSQSQESIFSLN